jgi:hypothetical protein
MRDFDFPATLESFQPVFKLDGVHLNVSSPEGASASLLCKIKNLGAKAVSIQNKLFYIFLKCRIFVWDFFNFSGIFFLGASVNCMRLF